MCYIRRVNFSQKEKGKKKNPAAAANTEYCLTSSIIQVQDIYFLAFLHEHKAGASFLHLKLDKGNFSEKAMAPHSSTLAWKIPWTEEPGRLQSMGSLRVEHD